MRTVPACRMRSIVEVLDRFFGGKNESQHIDVEVPVKMLFRDFFKWRKLIDACIVHQNVQPAERLLGLREDTFDIGGLGDIALDSGRLAAYAFDFCDHSISALAAGGVIDHDRSAGG